MWINFKAEFIRKKERKKERKMTNNHSDDLNEQYD